MENLRKEIISEARSWAGTPFKHQGRIKHIGCDCIGLIAGVFSILNLRIRDKKVSEFDIKNYSRIPRNNLLRNTLDKIFPETEEIKEGNLFLMRFLKEPQHVGFISKADGDNISIIHSYQQSKGVVEHNLSKNCKRRLVKFYDIETAITE